MILLAQQIYFQIKGDADLWYILVLYYYCINININTVIIRVESVYIFTN